MASKWKYADLDAGHRIELLKKGNKELFDEEVARTREVTKARRELGLDTSEQENWMDKVGYSYSLSLADKGTPVSKTGYAKLYLDGKTTDTELSPVARNRNRKGVGTAYYSNAKRKIENAQKLAIESAGERYARMKEEARKALYEKYPHLEEQLLNEGASPGGGKMKRAQELIEKQLADIYAELDVKLKEDLADIDKRYANFKEELNAHRNGGTAKESYGVIVDVLIKNAARKDGYDYTLIPGISGGKKRYDVVEESEEVESDTALLTDADISKGTAVHDDDGETVTDDTSREDNVTSENRAKSTFPQELYGKINEAAEKINSNPEKAVFAITELLTGNGITPKDAARIAAELVGTVVGKNYAKA